MSRTNDRYDVVILGVGLDGAALAAILARQKARVLMLDAAVHPRFDTGESTLPYTSAQLRLLAARYDVPELAWLATFDSIRRRVVTSCGIERNLGFVYHRAGKRSNPEEATQLILPGGRDTPAHWFRQDTDAHVYHAAIHHGAEAQQQVRVARVDFTTGGATVVTDKGEEFPTRFVVDAGGARSLLAKQLGLREGAPPLRHQSRALFTHMIGVVPYDEVAPPAPPSPWHQGTLHHVFDGGWLWVIPFDNHPRTRNPLSSVGLVLDPRVHPKPDGVGPEEEFRAFIARFPQIEPQFRGAKAARDWIVTGPMQFACRQVVGERWCLLANSAGFVDSLFSRPLVNTLEVVNALAGRLLEALAADDFAPAQFALVERLQAGLLAANDELAGRAFASFQDFHLWNGVQRVWAVEASLATARLEEACRDYGRGRDPAVFAALEESRHGGLPLPRHEPLHQFLAESGRAVNGAADAAAGDRLFELLRGAAFIPPALGLHDPANRHFHHTSGRTGWWWGRFTAEPAIGRAVRAGLGASARRRLWGE